MLENAGLEVIEALDADAAVEKLNHEKIDLVLLDIILPGKDGWSVLEEMKIKEDLKDLPVIVFTAKIEDERDRRYIQSYHLPVVRKPFEKNNLVETVSHGA